MTGTSTAGCASTGHRGPSCNLLRALEVSSAPERLAICFRLTPRLRVADPSKEIAKAGYCSSEQLGIAVAWLAGLGPRPVELRAVGMSLERRCGIRLPVETHKKLAPIEVVAPKREPGCGVLLRLESHDAIAA